MAPSQLADNSRPYSADHYGQVLTPRTPHSRAGQDADVDEVELLQTHPLLASSTSPTFPPDVQAGAFPSNGRRKASATSILSRLPLVLGCISAVVLLFLIFLSVKKPEVLLSAIGETELDIAGESPASLASATPETEEHSQAMPGDEHKKPNLIIDYSNYSSFPLLPADYLHECWLLNQEPHSHGRYWDPPHHGVADVPHPKAPGEGGVCSSTITYMLDGTVGLTLDLNLINQLAGLARDRNRTFFIDDRNWNRGKWTDYFLDVRDTQPGPVPGCLPPPPEELVACPRFARHWVMTSRTAKFHFGHDFANEFEDPYARSTARQKPLIEVAAESLATTIVPNSRMKSLIHLARSEISGPHIGVHIRRGDRKPIGWRWHRKPIPTEEYSNFAIKAWKELSSSNPPEVRSSIPTVWLATDSPTAREEFSDSARFRVYSLASSAKPELKELQSSREYIQVEWSQRPEDERVRETQGMVIDLALVSGVWTQPGDRSPLAAVCAVGSNVCKMTAVALGYDRSFVQDRWVEIENQKSIEPEWEPFELLW